MYLVTQLDDPCYSYFDFCMDHISSPKQQRNIVQLCTMELCATKMRERGFPQMFPWFLLKLSYRCILLSTVLLPLLQWHLPRWFSTNGISLLKILSQYFSRIELCPISILLEEDLVILPRFCVSADRSWRRCGYYWTGRQLWKRRCLMSWKRPYRSAWTFLCNIYFIFYSFRSSWGPWRGRRSTGTTWPRSQLMIKIPCWRIRIGWGRRWFSF